MSSNPEIRTRSGVVRGRDEEGLAVFRGIPFAQPPLGVHRFAAPAPVEPWDGVRDAFVFGPAAPQSEVMVPPGAPSLNPPTATDEWLTVNVWSPDLGSAALPVMVWIYGGAYLQGVSSDPLYDGRTLAGEGVVYVSVNYRVGVEGFAHIDGAPDNRGLLDQLAALRWVRENIAAFGGDPDNVTIFGQSAGGGCVASLMAMPSAAGLFHHAIAQSVPATFFSPALAADIGAAIATEIGLKPTVAALAAIPPLHLLAAGDAVTRKLPRFAERWGKLAHTLTPYSPVIDGDVLPQTPWAALERGSSRGVDLLVGHTRDEFRFFTLATGGPAAVTTDQATAALNVFAPDGADYRATYPGAGPGKLHELVNSDWLFRMPSLKLAEAHAAGGGRTWAYELCWGTGPLGATHGLDVLLTLGNLRGSPLAALLLGPDPSAEAAGLSRTMRTAWTAFATTGDPGWAGFDTGERLTRVYEAAPTTAPYPEETSRRIWENHRFEPLDLTTG